MRGDQNLTEQKPQLSRTGLGNVLLINRDSQQMDRVLLKLYNYKSCGDNAVLYCSQPPDEDLQPILCEKVEIAAASLKKGKSARVDNIPANLFKLVVRW